MDAVAIQKYVRVSPKKLRAVAALTKSMKPQKAVEVLPFSSKRSATHLLKVVKSAMANAKNKGVSPEDLIFKEIQVNEGPRLKRGRPVSRGRWHAYQKRMSHIRVVLTTKEVKPAKELQSKAKKQLGESKANIKDQKSNKQGKNVKSKNQKS
jgi:large subunit ribosomal protein L22